MANMPPAMPHTGLNPIVSKPMLRFSGEGESGCYGVTPITIEAPKHYDFYDINAGIPTDEPQLQEERPQYRDSIFDDNGELRDVFKRNGRYGLFAIEIPQRKIDGADEKQPEPLQQKEVKVDSRPFDSIWRFGRLFAHLVHKNKD
jgi:hypothetical protein